MLRTSLVLLSLTLSSLILHQRFSRLFCFRLYLAMSCSDGPAGFVGKESEAVTVCPAVEAALSGLGAEVGGLRLNADESEADERDESDEGDD
jgi:hypothetical protein